MSFLQDYQGGRDFNSLKKFAEENLGPFLGLNEKDREGQKRVGRALAPRFTLFALCLHFVCPCLGREVQDLRPSEFGSLQ